MKKYGILLVFLLSVVALISGCAEAPVQQEPQYQWVPITLRATGGGAPPARSVNAAQARLMTERAAKVDALRNLLEQAYGVNISSSTTVRDFITQNDTMRARVDAFIQGAKIVDTRYMQDGGVEVEMEIILGWEFRRIFP